MHATRWTTQGASLGVAVLTACLMLATEPHLAIVWDEGYTLGREARLRAWFRALADPVRFAERWTPPAQELVQQVGAPPPRSDQVNTRGKLLFDPRVLAWFWPFAREEPHGHPPFYALVGLIGDVLTPARPDLERARLGPILIFSLTAGALFGFATRRWGPWPGALAAGAWVLQPHLFGHGHYATYDAILSALWLDALLVFALAVENGAERSRPHWGWVVVFGGLAGCAAETKLTGWFLPLPFLVWSILYRSRRGFLTLLVGGAVAVVVIYVLNPPWWAEPVSGPVRFLVSNLRRNETIRIKTLFLGQVISTPDGSLPWYNTLAWTVFVTPIGFLALALCGSGRAFRRWQVDPFGVLVVGHWAFLLALRALPHTPGHDGVRQFLPAFGVLALLAGLGAASARERFGRAGRWLIGAALVEGVASVALMVPVPLSYYSPLVGGLPGATALGMEPTYYWDALSEESLDWLRAHTGPAEKVAFASFPTAWLYLRDTGRLPPRLLPNDPGVWVWYVLQNRPGSFRPVDRALVAQGRPAFVVRKLGVPLLWIFPYTEVEALSAPSQRDGDGQDAKRPTAARTSRSAVGPDQLTVRREPSGSQALTRRLARGLGRRLRGCVRSGVLNRGLVGNRGALDGLLLVAETAPLRFRRLGLVPALLRGRLADRHRGRWRARCRIGDRGRAGVLLLVATRLRLAGRQEGTEEARESQGQQVTSHQRCLRKDRLTNQARLLNLVI